MGKANRERRKAKQKQRTRSGAPPGSNGLGLGLGTAMPPTRSMPTMPSMPSMRDQVAALVDDAVHAIHRKDDDAVATLVTHLAGHDRAGWRSTVERVLDGSFTRTFSTVWRHGWQPVDLLRFAQRRLPTGQDRLFRAAMAAELARYAPTSVDPRWAGQLADGDVRVWWAPQLNAVQACGPAHPGGWPEFVGQALELLYALACLPVLEVLAPLPGTAVPTPEPRSGLDERVLARVRALLAKAESTPFEAEAETFTAGAQALMARHSIDHALLAATGRAPADRPTGRRVGVDNPYEAPKVTLLDAIASANRCRAVWSKELGFCTIVGFPTDLDNVEVLFTSLLLQAMAALNREGSRTDRQGRSRTRTFRQSFLLAYATGIRERLSDTTRVQTEAAAAEPLGSNLLPVLASRSDAVDDAFAGMFPQLTTRSAGSAWDREGWSSGRAAADLAALDSGAALAGR